MKGDEEIAATTVLAAPSYMSRLLASVGLSNKSRNDGSAKWNTGHKALDWDEDGTGTVASPFNRTVGVRLGVGDGGRHDAQDFSLFMFEHGNAPGYQNSIILCLFNKPVQHTRMCIMVYKWARLLLLS